MPALLLKKMPDDIRNYLLRLQLAAKMQKDRTQYSLETTIYNIIRAKMKSDDTKK